MSKHIYLDNAATTRTAPEVVEAMLPYFSELYGNASTVYEFGAKSKEAVTAARETIANAIGAQDNEIYFTAGGSESDNWALKATAEAYKDKGQHIITSKIEHHAILHTCEWLEKNGFEVTYLDVDEFGVVKLDELKRLSVPIQFSFPLCLPTMRLAQLSQWRRLEKLPENMAYCFTQTPSRHLGSCPSM